MCLSHLLLSDSRHLFYFISYYCYHVCLLVSLFVFAHCCCIFALNRCYFRHGYYFRRVLLFRKKKYSKWKKQLEMLVLSVVSSEYAAEDAQNKGHTLIIYSS